MEEKEIIGGFDESRIINKDYLNSLEGVYKCGICFKIMDNPTDCETCGHSFCFECIKRLKCPFKCKNKELKPSSKSLKDILNKLKFKCLNIGCEQILNYSDVKLHDKNCEFQEIICPNNGCNQKLIKKNLENHVLNECQYALVKCQFCDYQFNKNDIINHEKSCSIVNNSLKSNEANDKINMNNNLDTNEYIKLLSMNVSKIVKDNQELLNINKNNNENDNDNDNQKLLFSQVVSRPSNPNNYAQIDEDELLNLIKEGIEDELQKYFLDFEKNFLKISKDIKDIKEHLNNRQNQEKNDKINNSSKNNILIIDETGELNKMNSIKEENEEDIDDNSNKNIKDIINKTENNLKNAVSGMNEKILEKLKTFSVKLEENIKAHNSGNNNNLTNQQKLIIENINNSIDRIIENIQETKTKINTLSNDIHNKTSLFEELNKNIILSIEQKSKKEKTKDEKDKINLDNNINIEIENIQTTLSLIKNSIKQVTNTLSEEFADLTELIKGKTNKEKEKNENSNININKEEKKSNYLSLNIDSLHKFSFGGDIIDKNKIQSPKLLSISNNKPSSQDLNINKTLELQSQNFSLAQISNNSAQIQISKNKNKDSFNSDDNNQHKIIISNLENRMNNLENFVKNMETEIKQNITNQFNAQAKNFNLLIQQNLDNKIGKMFTLKYCKECEKVDYFYAFKKCAACGIENCKQCITLCLNCKILFCKNCCTCIKCNKNYCVSCRILCTECNKKYCKNCLMNCSTCNKLTCLSCIKQCFNCKNYNCNEYCSITCYICNKNICNKCSTENQKIKCNSCKNNICEECVKFCEFCKNKICKNCQKLCQNCNMKICKSCNEYCHDCKKIFCKKCSSDKLEKKCDLCNNIFCYECGKNFGNCYVCMKNICKNCYAKCLCGNTYCNTCSLECEKCGKRVCNICSGKCVCDIAVFCDECLKQNMECVLLHDCLYFINDIATFDKKKTRSKISFNVNDNFEIKLYVNNINRLSKLLIGFTDNGLFQENDDKIISNIYAINLINGNKFCSENNVEESCFDMNLIKDENICVYLMIKNKKLFFKVNNSEYKSGFDLTKDEYWIYLEKINSEINNYSNQNNSNNFTNSEFISDDSSLGVPKVKFIYAKKI